MRLFFLEMPRRVFFKLDSGSELSIPSRILAKHHPVERKDKIDHG